MVLGFGVLCAVAREGQRESSWWLILLVFLGTGFTVAVLSFLGGHWSADKFGFLYPIIERVPRVIPGMRGAETGFHPNEIAGALTWVLPLLICISIVFFFPRARRADPEVEDKANVFIARLTLWQLWGVRAIAFFVTVFVVGVFILTQSRSGYLGLLLTGLMLTLVVLFTHKPWYAVRMLVVLGLILGVLWLINSNTGILDWTAESDASGDVVFSLNSLEKRVELWSRAVYGIQDFPFTGMGMNTFRRVVQVLYPLFLVSPDVDIGHAHNEFLQVGLDLGIPGLIAFGSIYMIAFWMLWEMWRSMHHLPGFFNLKMATLLGLGGGLLAHMIYGLTDAVALGAKPGILYWMLLGLIAGLYTRTQISPGMITNRKGSKANTQR
jgi:putative inorganic carbon (HCO3(-)) transporter